ncbi:MAG TPA: hypothetical protein VHW23_40950 [Kofleriaceae bacterium]|jgi:hypothetical protein|nr:hypothetical protein [Kofleriaceae bacterium]
MADPRADRAARSSTAAPVARCAIAVSAVVAAACHGAASPRERVLAGLPGDAVVVIAADGRALAHPQLRGALDVVAARWPDSLGCVADAAAQSDAVAASVDRAGNTAVLLALPRPPRCPALSERAPGLWIATIGAGPNIGLGAGSGSASQAPAGSVLVDPRFARVRSYLTSAPIAVAVLGDVHVLAAAQPDPLDAWVAIDVPGSAEPVAQAIAARIAELAREPAAAAVAGKLRVERPAASQLVVRLSGAPTGAAGGGFAAAVRAALAWADAERDRGPPAERPFACPAPGPGVTCSGGTRYAVASLSVGLAPILAAGRPAPVVVNGSVAGLRLGAAVPGLGLEAGDVIVAVAGRLVSSRTMLAERIAQAGAATTVTVRRGTEEAMLEFAER